MGTDDKEVQGVETKLDVSADQSVKTDVSAGAEVSVGVKPVEVATSFNTTVDVSFPEFRVGSSGFSLELFGIPVFGMDPCYLATEGATEAFGSLLFGRDSQQPSRSSTPAYRITDKCIGCSTCARQCPTGAIYGVAKKRFHVEPSMCILCGTCGRACPASAIVDPAGDTVQRVKPKEKKVPVVIEEQCSGCTNCVNICPFNCLAIKEDEATETIKGVSFLAKKAKCVACGECERVCPQEAIVLMEPVVEEKKVA